MCTNYLAFKKHDVKMYEKVTCMIDVRKRADVIQNSHSASPKKSKPKLKERTFSIRLYLVTIIRYKK